MKKYIYFATYASSYFKKTTIIFSLIIFLFGCSNTTSNRETGNGLDTVKMKIKNMMMSSGMPESDYFYVKFRVQADSLNFNLPVLQSCVTATYNGAWIFIGGQVKGFHGTSNNPPPFMSSVANDSIYLVDMTTSGTLSVKVPSMYANYLSATNSASYQVGNKLYLCGGFTVKDSSAANFNWTSDRFFEINLDSLVKYIKSGGKVPSSAQVFTKVIQSPFVQVTGGEMMVVNNFYYLIGGQNYTGLYSPGNTGTYTNAIRRFTIQSNGSVYTIADTTSLIDTVYLHRRDLNVMPAIVNGNDSMRAVIYGGVFTRLGEAYRNPVYITGLTTGNVSITVDSMKQKVNQYNCANSTITLRDPVVNMNMALLLGGISYMRYDADSGKLVTGDHGFKMPFSNLISLTLTDGQSMSKEFVQVPSDSLLPAYIGSNAIFFPQPQYLMNGYNNILDYTKIFPGSSTAEAMIGYLYGGILSMGPTSGTTPDGHVNTYANPVLYKVYIYLLK